MNRKRIGTFKEFKKSQRILNEDVTVEVEWWDECKVQVLSLLETECEGYLCLDRLSDFCKKKDAIIGRAYNQDVRNNVLLHIKEHIYQMHWQSFYNTEMSSQDGENSALHGMGLVVEGLAREIYDRIMEKSNSFAAPDTTTRLAKEPILEPEDEFPGENCVDLPWEYDNESRKVMKFQDYKSKINESVAILDCGDKERCVEYCLKRIKKEVGSLVPNDILPVAIETADGLVKSRLIRLYVQKMILMYFEEKGVSMFKPGEDSGDIPKEVINQAIDTLSWDLSDDVLVRIAKENGIVADDEETK